MGIFVGAVDHDNHDLEGCIGGERRLDDFLLRVILIPSNDLSVRVRSKPSPEEQTCRVALEQGFHIAVVNPCRAVDPPS